MTKTPAASPTNSRTYPAKPILGVGAVVLDGDAVVLVRRRFEPLAGHWSLPGGAVEVGETLEEAVRREVAEETGLAVRVGPLIEVFDRITRDADGRVKYHYVLADYLCWATGGSLVANDDVDDVVLTAVSDLQRFNLTDKTTDVIAAAVALSRR